MNNTLHIVCEIACSFLNPLNKGVELGAFGALTDRDGCGAHEHIHATVAMLGEMESVALRAHESNRVLQSPISLKICWHRGCIHRPFA